MKIISKYSHLNGLEWLLYTNKELWEEIENALHNVDAEQCRTKISKEKTIFGEKLYSPSVLNKEIKKQLHIKGWCTPQRYDYFLSDDIDIIKHMIHNNMSMNEQENYIKSLGKNPKNFHKGFNQSDFFKNRISIEVQFGKYSFVQYDFYKHSAGYLQNKIDLGIEIVPMKSMEKHMSSGPSNYERNLHEILCQGRIFPPVPLILIGVDK